MNRQILNESIKRHLNWAKANPDEYEQALAERVERKAYFQSWTRDRLLAMDEEGYLEFMSKLRALRMWGNKPHIVDYIIGRNGMARLREELAALVWGDAPMAQRWDRLRKGVKDMSFLDGKEPDRYSHEWELSGETWYEVLLVISVIVFPIVAGILIGGGKHYLLGAVFAALSLFSIVCLVVLCRRERE